MINFIYGKLIEINEGTIIVETNGVGFEINFSNSNIENLPSENENVKIYTYMAVKEDDISLYGFLTKEDKIMFLNLLDCDGVGPKGAMKIISNIGFDNLINYISANNSEAIAKVPGIGKKTSEKICIELRDKIKKLGFVDVNNIHQNEKVNITVENEAIKALIKLGYKNKDAKNLVKEVGITPEDTVETVLKNILKKR